MKSYRDLLVDLWSNFTYRLVGLLALMVFTGLTEGLAVALLLPLFARLGISSAPQQGTLSGALFDLDRMLGSGWVNLGGLIVAVSILQGLLVLAQGWTIASVTHDYTARWKLRLSQAFLFAEWTYVSEHKAGELINAITAETGRLSAAAQSMLSLLAALIVAIIYLGYGFALSAPVTWSILLLTAVLVLLLGQLYRVSFDLGQQTGPLQAEQQVLVGELIQGIKAVKAAVMEERAIERISVTVAQLERAARTAGFLPHVVRAVFESGGLIALVGLLVVAVTWLNAPLANLLIVIALFVRLFPRLSSIQQYAYSLNSFVPAVSELIQTAKLAEARAERKAETTRSVLRIVLPSLLRLKDVRVSLGGTPILQGVDLSIPIPGITAIVGVSGAGKSTLLASLLRLVPIDGGSITIGGRSVHELSLTEWRRSIGFVPQDPILFHASIRDNLSIAWPDKTMDDIIAAAKLAQLDAYIDTLPDGYDTIVGDQGMRLSGGQRQRLGLARALLGNPKILILDEATSALDSVTENAVLDTIDGLTDKIGVVLVAHRMASVRRAQQIAVMERGKIVDSGTWESLMASSPTFGAYATAQQIG